MRPGLWATVTALSIAGCHPNHRPPPTEAPAAPPAPGEGASQPDVIRPCGPTGERLHGLSWVPTEARLAALVELQAEELDASLHALAQLARGEAHGLPTDVAFGLAQWDFQIPLLRTTLHEAGFDPAEIAVVRLEDVGTAWVFGSTCDLDLAIERVQKAWGVEVRRTANGAIGTPRDDHAFAFDVVFLPGDRVAMAPAGRGPALTRALATPGSPTDAPRPGQVVEAIEPAPIRAFVRGPALARSDTSTVEHRLRGTDRGIEIDGSLEPLP
jgi:hypothetical protein